MQPIEKQIEPLLECAEKLIAKHPNCKDEIYSIIDLVRIDLEGKDPFRVENTIIFLEQMEAQLDEFSKASGEM